MMTVALSGKRAAGRVALIDDEDWPLVAPHLWWVLEFERKGRRAGPYAYSKLIRDDGSQVPLYMHKLITGYPMTDHIDHDGLNNQRSNLRPATRSQNQQNRRSRTGTSSFKGVHWVTAARRWRAAICINGTTRHLGHFASEEEAALAYNAAALQAFGAYACLNPVGGGPAIPAA
jgi:hypothetical protein